jgi:hypothetical protein
LIGTRNAGSVGPSSPTDRGAERHARLRALLHLDLFDRESVLGIILQSAGPIARVLGQTGMNVATRFMGLILAAIAVEFITTGLSEIFPGWSVP